MVDSTEDFFESTGQNADTFTVTSVTEKAKSFTQKIEDLIKPELAAISENEKARAERLNAQPKVISSVKNTWLFYGLAFASIYIVYRIVK